MDFLNEHEDVKKYAENVYLWRRARFIGPKDYIPEDKGIAKDFLKYWSKHKDANFDSWIEGYFRSAERR